MTRVSLDSSAGHLEGVLRDLCTSEWGEACADWRVVGRWNRPYSEVRLVEVQTARLTHRLIAKRAVRRSETEDVFEHGNVAQREFDALRQAERALTSLLEGGVPRAIHVAPDVGWLLMEYVSGAELDRKIAGARWFTSRKRGQAAERHFERLGDWLRVYQAKTKCDIDAQVLHDDAERSRMRLSTLTATPANLSEELAAKIADRLKRLERQIVGPLPGSACHGDFGPWNALVTRDHLNVVDFFCQHTDSIWVDPLNVVTYLRTQHPSVTLSRRRVERLRDAFLRGYGKHLEVDCPEYRLCLAIHQISRLQDAICAPCRSWTDRYRRGKVVRELLKELVEKRRVRHALH